MLCRGGGGRRLVVRVPGEAVLVDGGRRGGILALALVLMLRCLEWCV
jgi:hypothetical protein